MSGRRSSWSWQRRTSGRRRTPLLAGISSPRSMSSTFDVLAPLATLGQLLRERSWRNGVVALRRSLGPRGSEGRVSLLVLLGRRRAYGSGVSKGLDEGVELAHLDDQGGEEDVNGLFVGVVELDFANESCGLFKDRVLFWHLASPGGCTVFGRVSPARRDGSGRTKGNPSVVIFVRG